MMKAQFVDIPNKLINDNLLEILKIQKVFKLKSCFNAKAILKYLVTNEKDIKTLLTILSFISMLNVNW